MAFFKVATLMLLVASAYGAPQLGAFDGDDFDYDSADFAAQMFDANPVYTYSYQVAADDQQTYIAHQENRDGAAVTGEYSYVDPLGALVTVTYTAGPDGYQEERNVQANFVQIRAKPAVAVQTAQVAVPQQVTQVVEQVRPVVQTAVSSTSGSSDTDLVARIIAQLTPFIKDTVSSSLGSSSGSSSTTTTTTVQQPAVQTVRRVVAAPRPAVRVAPVAVDTAASAVAGIFGTGGPNNVRVDTPDFNFAYELEK